MFTLKLHRKCLAGSKSTSDPREKGFSYYDRYSLQVPEKNVMKQSIIIFFSKGSKLL